MNDRELHDELERNHPAGYGWAMTCCSHDAMEAEDVLQTVYMKVLDGRARYDGRAAFRTWLFAVIRRTAADARRRRWMQTLGLARYERVRTELEPEQPSARMERSEQQETFLRALDRLPRRQREVLHLVFYQSLSLDEAAGVMGVSVGSVRQHYARGKDRLRAELEGVAP